MGGFSLVQEFEHHDWRIGVNILKQQAEDYYGHQEGYSGAINSCSVWLHTPKTELKTKKQLNMYIEDRLTNLATGDAECVRLTQTGYTLIKPVITVCSFGLCFNPLNISRKGYPAVLVSGHGEPHSYGTLSQMKQKVKSLLIRNKFEKDYFIVTKTTVYRCSGDKKYVKSSIKKSTSEKLVLPLYKYVVYGWARH